MSDDDLWRFQEPSSADKPDQAAETGKARDRPAAGVGDETQPLSGSNAARPAPPDPPPSPPSAGPGAVPPPANPFGQPPPQNPYAPAPQGNPYGVPTTDPAQGSPYGAPGQPGAYPGSGYLPPTNPYPVPNEYATPQNPYGTPYQPAYAGGALPDHPSATTAMVLGIISLVGIALCAGITLILAPAAWVVGAKAVRQIDEAPGRYAGRDRAQAGRIMGIIGTVLLVLGVLAIIAIVVLAVSVGTSDSQPGTPTFGNGGA